MGDSLLEYPENVGGLIPSIGCTMTGGFGGGSGLVSSAPNNCSRCRSSRSDRKVFLLAGGLVRACGGGGSPNLDLGLPSSVSLVGCEPCCAWVDVSLRLSSSSKTGAYCSSYQDSSLLSMLVLSSSMGALASFESVGCSCSAKK